MIAGPNLDGAEVRQLAEKIASLSQELQGAGSRAPWSLGSFLGGALLACAVVMLAWHRYKYSLSRGSARRRQREAVRQLNQLDADELRRLLGGVNLPSWVTYPDYQRVQWVSTMVRQIYPYFAKYMADWAEEAVPPMLTANKPPWMRSIKLHHFSLGPVAPEPMAVKVYTEDESRNDEVVLEFDFVWSGEQHVSFVVKPVPKAATHAATRLPVFSQLVDMISNIVIIKVAVENMTLNGRLRLTLRPLLGNLPLVGSVQMAFTEIPKFAFDLTVYGGDVSVLPGMETWLHGLITDAVLAPFVLPEKLTIPFVDTASQDFERPRGLLQAGVKVIEAEHVPRMDLLSKSDPYVELSVRAKNKVKTQVLENTHRPQWNEDFSLMVHFPETQVLTCKLYDYDVFDRDDEIGRCTLKVRNLREEREVDEWYTVEPPHQEQPASGKYRAAGNPISGVVKEGQKAVGALIRPWDTAKGLRGRLTRGRVKHKCRLHLKVRFLEFRPEEVDAAVEARRDPGKGWARDTLAQASPLVRQALQGGALCVRILRVEGLAGRTWLLGGWRPSVQVRVWFAGEMKKTLSVKGKKDAYNVDQELEFVIGGDVASQPHCLEMEVWDVHWRNAFKGRAGLPFRAIRDAKLWRGTLDLKDARQGRISLEAQWMAAFTT
ncbi:hypothetical protein ABPG77_002402 [Micractinium sp. CCAP 211/92]